MNSGKGSDKSDFEKYQKGRVVHVYPKRPEREKWEARAEERGLPLATYLREVINTYPGIEERVDELAREAGEARARPQEELRELEREYRETEKELRECKRKARAGELFYRFMELEFLDSNILIRIADFIEEEGRITIESVIQELGLDESEAIRNTIYLYLELLTKINILEREDKEYFYEPSEIREITDFYREMMGWLGQ